MIPCLQNFLGIKYLPYYVFAVYGYYTAISGYIRYMYAYVYHSYSLFLNFVKMHKLNDVPGCCISKPADQWGIISIKFFLKRNGQAHIRSYVLKYISVISLLTMAVKSVLPTPTITMDSGKLEAFTIQSIVCFISVTTPS